MGLHYRMRRKIQRSRRGKGYWARKNFIGFLLSILFLLMPFIGLTWLFANFNFENSSIAPYVQSIFDFCMFDIEQYGLNGISRCLTLFALLGCCNFFGYIAFCRPYLRRFSWFFTLIFFALYLASILIAVVGLSFNILNPVLENANEVGTRSTPYFDVNSIFIITLLNAISSIIGFIVIRFKVDPVEQSWIIYLFYFTAPFLGSVILFFMIAITLGNGIQKLDDISSNWSSPADPYGRKYYTCEDYSGDFYSDDGTNFYDTAGNHIGTSTDNGKSIDFD